MKNFAGVDPSNVDYIVLAVRFRKPTADLTFMPPEVMAMTSGDFSSDSLMTLARMAADGKLRDEKYGAKTLGLMTIDPIAKEAEKNPILKSFSEVAIVALGANSIAVGTRRIESCRRRLGRQRTHQLRRPQFPPARSECVDQYRRVALTSFSKTFGLLGTETNARARAAIRSL